MNAKVSVIQQSTKTGIWYWANTLKVTTTREITIFPIKCLYFNGPIPWIQLYVQGCSFASLGHLYPMLYFSFCLNLTKPREWKFSATLTSAYNLPWHLNPVTIHYTRTIHYTLYTIHALPGLFQQCKSPQPSPPPPATNPLRHRGSQSLQYQTCIP